MTGSAGKALLLLSFVCLAACARAEQPVAVEPGSASDPDRVVSSGPLPPSAEPIIDTGIGPPNQCGVERYRSLVGQHRSNIPPQPPGATWRVACTTCPVTEDYSPTRLNIFYNERTGVVKSVTCG